MSTRLERELRALSSLWRGMGAGHEQDKKSRRLDTSSMGWMIE
jgi:hypothetical protein